MSVLDHTFRQRLLEFLYAFIRDLGVVKDHLSELVQPLRFSSPASVTLVSLSHNSWSWFSP